MVVIGRYNFVSAQHRLQEIAQLFLKLLASLVKRLRTPREVNENETAFNVDTGSAEYTNSRAQLARINTLGLKQIRTFRRIVDVT